MKSAMMFLATAILSLAPMLAMANCTTYTIMQGGKMVTCTSCCYYGNCNIMCF